MQRMTIADTKQARQIVEEGLAMCPRFQHFIASWLLSTLNDYWLGSSKSPQESIDKAQSSCRKHLPWMITMPMPTGI